MEFAAKPLIYRGGGGTVTPATVRKSLMFHVEHTYAALMLPLGVVIF